MTDVPPTAPTPPPESPRPAADDFVGQVVEKAAEKVASVSTMSHTNGDKPLGRIEGFALAGILIILNLACLVTQVQASKSHEGHRSDFRTVCQIIVERAATPDNARDLAGRLAECLDND